jgi:hypothetical protein
MPPAFGLKPLLFLFPLLPRKPCFRFELFLLLFMAKDRLELEDNNLLPEFPKLLSPRDLEPNPDIEELLPPEPIDERDD